MADYTDDEGATDGAADNGNDTPSKRLNLNNIAGVRRELARLYRDARAELIPSQDASRLANMLNILAGMIERSDLEQRIAKLEERKQL